MSNKINIFKSIKPFIVKHEPELLLAMGVSGLIFSTIWAIKATFKASKKIDIRKEELGVDKLTPKETFLQVWKDYLPVAVSIAVSVPCIIASNRISTKRNAALAAAYTLSETALQSYQEKTKEVVGEKKEKEIQEAVSKDIIAKSDQSKANIVLNDDSESIFYEPISGRYFKTSWNHILRAANELNATAIGEVAGDITLTDWFYELGLDKTNISDNMGWTVTGGKSNMLSVEINSALTKDNKPCGAIYYRVLPKAL